MKKLLVIFLLALPVFIFSSLYFIDQTHFICPIKYQSEMVVRSDGRGDGFFGAERSGRRVHEGIDLLAKVGTPVLASRSGKVIAAKRNRGMGKYVILRHASGLTSIYGHLSEIYVKQNQFVRRGQVIGAAGKTGNANYRDMLSHLHFEIRKGGVPQDPLEYIWEIQTSKVKYQKYTAKSKDF